MRTAIGADFTGSTGNFAPVLMKEQGQTLPFAPVTFRGLLMCIIRPSRQPKHTATAAYTVSHSARRAKSNCMYGRASYLLRGQ